MKTVTITLHDTDNCGSSLQAYALQHFLILNNIDNEIIDYVPEYVTNNGNKIKTIIRKIIYYKESKNRKIKFDKFVTNYLVLSKKKYSNYKELCEDFPKADCYITGSDQLWNSMYGCGQDPAFYLNFVKERKKIAYAVSLGREEIPDENLSLVKKYAQDYSWISVREKSSVDQVKKVVENVEVDYVCDPVLLNEAKEYEIIKNDKIINEKYILLYMAQIPNSSFMNEIIEKIKKQINGKIVLIGSYRNRCQCDMHIRDVAPGEFLSLIFNAEYIISNSFHATMFSLIYEKQFLSILPDKNGARIKEILEYVNLADHTLKSDENFVKLPIIEDYSVITDKLKIFRSESQKKLLDYLRNLSNEQ